MFVLVYVDDIIVTSTEPTYISCLIHALGKEFAVKHLGSLPYFLGIQATRNDNGLHLSQEKYDLLR